MRDSVVQFPTIDRVADEMRLLLEVGLPYSWSLPQQRALKLMIDRSSKPIGEITIGEILRMASAVRDTCQSNPDLVEVDDGDG